MKEIASKLSLTNRKKHLDRGPGLYKRNMAEVEAIVSYSLSPARGRPDGELDAHGTQEKQLREAEMLRKRQEWDAARAAGSAKPASMVSGLRERASERD